VLGAVGAVEAFEGRWVAVSATGAVTYRRCFRCSGDDVSRGGFCVGCWSVVRTLPYRARGLRESALALDRASYRAWRDRREWRAVRSEARELLSDAGLARSTQLRLAPLC
jgi:hypothetical protein